MTLGQFLNFFFISSHVFITSPFKGKDVQKFQACFLWCNLNQPGNNSKTKKVGSDSPILFYNVVIPKVTIKIVHLYLSFRSISALDLYVSSRY